MERKFHHSQEKPICIVHYLKKQKCYQRELIHVDVLNVISFTSEQHKLTHVCYIKCELIHVGYTERKLTHVRVIFSSFGGNDKKCLGEEQFSNGPMLIQAQLKNNLCNIALARVYTNIYTDHHFSRL